MQQEIGSYHAKTKLPELLRLVSEGDEFVITNRGNPVARLIPYQAGPSSNQMVLAAIAHLKTFKIESLKRKINIKALIEEGRV